MSQRLLHKSSTRLMSIYVQSAFCKDVYFGERACHCIENASFPSLMYNVYVYLSVLCWDLWRFQEIPTNYDVLPLPSSINT